VGYGVGNDSDRQAVVNNINTTKMPAFSASRIKVPLPEESKSFHYIQQHHSILGLPG
jgi:hypothetical protein